MDFDDNGPLAAALSRVLLTQGMVLLTAESCTGGLLSATATALPGSSQWFESGWVSYSNDAKRKMFGVQESALEQYGAVSGVVARQMVVGVLKQRPQGKRGFGISVTGIAGPSGAVPGKPVGTVCFGFGAAELDGSITAIDERQQFFGNRDQIRSAAVRHAFEQGCRWLESYCGCG